MNEEARRWIEAGKTFLGIEFGSTRIKAVLIGDDYTPLATGSFEWDNRFENGIWTYHLEDVWAGLQACYADIVKHVWEQYKLPIKTTECIGISAMMHGYLPFDNKGNQLSEFRTWRNTTAEKAASILTDAFSFNIPDRWSIAHLHQAVMKEEKHVKDLAFLTTLSGYVHWKLTGEKVLGIGDASGMFPIDSENGTYDKKMMDTYDAMVEDEKYQWKTEGMLPKVLMAGENAGILTKEGAMLLDVTCNLLPGIPLCPPEGDAGTGMVATNSVTQLTGNVSAGTSIFAMVVLQRPLSKVYREIDLVTTPSGIPVAMAHTNNCTGDLDAWVKVFDQALALFGIKANKSELYEKLYNEALHGDADCSGLVSYNYYAGEFITALESGRPLFARMPDANFTLANFMRCMLFSAMATLKMGLNILTENENVALTHMVAHGGLFKTKLVGQHLLAAALNVPISVMPSASEGGAFGVALLAAFMANKKSDETLEAFLNQHIFTKNDGDLVSPSERDLEGFSRFMERYERGLPVERAATNAIN